MWLSAYRPRVPASCAAARSSPAPAHYSFQGLRAEGLELLQARAVTGQPIVTELMNNRHIHLFEDAHVDMIQIGARNIQGLSC